MKKPRLRETAIKFSIIVASVVLLVILAAAGLILQDEKNSIMESVSLRTETLAKRVGAAMFPKEDLFSMHLMVSTMQMEKMVKYAVITDKNGMIRSHSDPGKIGAPDGTPEGEKARESSTRLTQTFRGSDGLDYYYFSEPIMVGGTRIGTASVAVNSETIKPRMKPVKEKLLIIFGSALITLLLLLELRALTKREQVASALKSAMVHAVSHEFNNALSVIDASVFLLKESEPKKDDSSRQEIYETLAYEQNFLKSMVKNILNEARMEAGKFKIEKRPMAMRENVAAIMASIGSLMRNKQITFNLDTPKDPVIVNADPEALSLVISNLIGNAVKYTPEKGEIRVKITRDEPKEGLVTFCVENSGAGISPADIGRIKEEFYRPEATRASIEGFGLGLKICNEMLLLHNSALDLSSEEGKTTRFYFNLPIMTEKELRAASTISVPGRKISSSRT